jgi:hypothetical protein
MDGWVRGVARIVLAGVLMLATAGIGQAAGALAVGACGAYGAAFDYRGPDAARSAALGKCSGDCKVVQAMKRNCAALAIDGHKPCGALGYAAAPRLGLAQNTALSYCYRYGGKDCVIRAWACDAKG